MTRRALRVLLCAAFVVPGAARGQTSPEGRAVFTVTTASNSAGPGPCTAASCTLNQAIQAANANPNGSQPDLIRFAVPGPETVSIAVTATEPVETITEGVEIDGYSQPGASPNTIPFGAGGLDSVLRVELLGDGASTCLTVLGGDSILRGLAISGCATAIHLPSDGSVVEGCYVGARADGAAGMRNTLGILIQGSWNRVGSATPADRNLISNNVHGVQLTNPLSSNNVIQGNLVGTTRDGHGSLGNRSSGIFITPVMGPNPPGHVQATLIGGAASGEGNVIAGNDSASFPGNGILLTAFSGEVDGTRVEGNFLGLDAEGDDVLPNTTDVAIQYPNAHDNVVGGPGAGQRNWMAGGLVSVWLQDGARANTIAGNDIGLSVTGAARGTRGVAVRIENSSDNRVIGNRIRGAASNGIRVDEISSPASPPIARRNVLSMNSIDGSGALGIDLGSAGVTPNDPGDGDEGPNGLQNFPVISDLTPAGGVSGLFSGAPSTDVTLEFFSASVPDPSGHGEGDAYLGSSEVTTDAAGIAPFVVALSSFESGAWVSATATVAAAGTSEFGSALQVPFRVGREPAHGSRMELDLSDAGQARFRIVQAPRSSYEVIVDALAGASAPVVLERVARGGAVLQTGTAVGTGSSMSLRWQNASSSSVEEAVHVRSGSCSQDCGSGDRLRIRAYETTMTAARFNNQGTQVTLLVLQNTTAVPLTGRAYFWSAAGQLLHDEPFALPPHGLSARTLSEVSALSGASGSITAAHDGAYGALAGKGVVLEAATGFSFDTALQSRPR